MRLAETSAPGARDRAPRSKPLEPLGGETPSKELRHARPVSCGGHSLVGTEGTNAAVYPMRCRCWRCSWCGRWKLNQTRKRIRAGLALGDAWLVTLTCQGDESADVSFEQLSMRWKRLLLRITRRFGRIEYVTVVEFQERGNPHLHFLVRGLRIPVAWLRRAAAAVGFGRVVDVREPKGGIAGYLTKAIGPNTSGDKLPRGFHRVRWSAGWSIPSPRRVKRVWQAWFVANAGTLRAFQSAVRRGYRVTELVHGPPDRRTSLFPVSWRPVEALRDGWGARP